MLRNTLDIPMTRILAQLQSLGQITRFAGVDGYAPTLRFGVIHNAIVKRSLRVEHLLEARKCFGALVQVVFGKALQWRKGRRIGADLQFETLQAARRVGNGHLLLFVPGAQLLVGEQTVTYLARVEVEQCFHSEAIFARWIFGQLTLGELCARAEMYEWING